MVNFWVLAKLENSMRTLHLSSNSMAAVDSMLLSSLSEPVVCRSSRSLQRRSQVWPACLPRLLRQGP